MAALFLAVSFGSEFDGFHGVSFALLVLAGAATVLFLAVFAWRWTATFPYLPDAGPPTDELGPEPPAVVNLLANRWRVTRSALAATVTDLAARKMLDIDQLDRHHFVVRLQEHRVAGQQLTEYERQALDLVRSRATGGSCPAEALELGPKDEAGAWWKRFRKAVEGDARKRGLARNRWATWDLALLGAALVPPLGLAALAFGIAHLGDNGTGGDDSIDPSDWLMFAAVAWFALMALIATRRDIRDTPAGDAACSRWLGVRDFYRHAHAFDNVPVAAVAVWERHLAHGIALGVAHEAAEGLPFDVEDPEVAWSRSSGDWRQVRIAYPAWFGAGQAPARVVLVGLLRTAFWGTIAFYAFPIAAQFTWDAAHELIDGASLGNADQDRAVRIFVATFAVIMALIGVYVAAQLLRGVVRLYRGLLDLRAPETIEGDVIKLHLGRAAIDDGRAPETVAWRPPPGTPALQRGARLRITKTRHLHYVSSVAVLSTSPMAAPARAAAAPAVAAPARAAAAVAAPAAGPARPASDAPSAPEVQAAAAGPVPALAAQAVNDATGLSLEAQTRDLGGAGRRQVFADARGNRITITATPLPEVAMSALAFLRAGIGKQGIPVAGLGEDAWWDDRRGLTVHADGELLTIDADLPGQPAPARREAAQRVAALALKMRAK